MASYYVQLLFRHGPLYYVPGNQRYVSNPPSVDGDGELAYVP